MTKFIDKSKQVKEVKKTIFTRCLINETDVRNDDLEQPGAFHTVEFIGHDSIYGDVFKVHRSAHLNDFTLYFGTKGDEMYVNE